MKKIFFICMVAICSHAFSQAYMNNWFFGNNASLDFSSGTPVYAPSPMASLEANATISDSLGNLLFFTNGISIWDRNENMMPNGDSLEIGQQGDWGSSITQGVIILPVPASPDKYYVFYLARVIDDINNLNTLVYSVVDMTLNSGNGDIVAGQKNIYFEPSDSYIWEKMTAVKHANGKDWWLITTSGKTIDGDSTYFEKFLITEDGISAPTFQPYDFWSTDGYDGWVVHGQMKFSLSGTKLAVTRSSWVDVFDFNRCDGMLSNRLIIDSLPLVSYGLEFSPDETKLYVSSAGNTPLKPHLTQICLNCNTIIKTTLFTLPPLYNIGQLQVAPNGKIYTGFADQDFLEDDARYLSVINYPDSFGVACNFELASFMLGDSGRIRYGLPNFVNYDLAALAIPCDTTTDIAEQIINKEEIIIYPNPTNNYSTISSHFNNYTNTQAEMYNMAGIKVKEITLTSSSQKIDLSALAAGVYALAIKQQGNVVFSSILVKE